MLRSNLLIIPADFSDEAVITSTYGALGLMLVQASAKRESKISPQSDTECTKKDWNAKLTDRL